MQGCWLVSEPCLLDPGKKRGRFLDCNLYVSTVEVGVLCPVVWPRLRGCPAPWVPFLSFMFESVPGQATKLELCGQWGCCDKHLRDSSPKQSRWFCWLSVPCSSPSAGSCDTATPRWAILPPALPPYLLPFPPAMYKWWPHQCQFTKEVPVRSDSAPQVPSCRNQAFTILLVSRLWHWWPWENFLSQKVIPPVEASPLVTGKPVKKEQI